MTMRPLQKMQNCCGEMQQWRAGGNQQTTAMFKEALRLVVNRQRLYAESAEECRYYRCWLSRSFLWGMRCISEKAA